jgi:adenine deaminase
MDNRKSFIVKGVVVDPVQRTQKAAEVSVEDGRITKIVPVEDVTGPYILPGFVDAHMHVESSMLIPSRLASLAVKHGTVGVVTDPHEVANVAGIAGINFMKEDGLQVPVEFFFGAPSCVPASPLEKSGAVIGVKEVEELLKQDDIYYLSEMMNFPGVINGDEDVWGKIRSALELGKPIDGHAPGLSGQALKDYVKAGITTDHECSTLEEAQEKLQLGMKILIREGSAARSFERLIPLMRQYSSMLMFCTDDCHPDYITKGHINRLVSRAIVLGYDLFDVLMVACINPVLHYKLPLGMLRVGDRADFIMVEDLRDFQVLTTCIAGKMIRADGQNHFHLPVYNSPPAFPFRATFEGSLKVIADGSSMNVIEAVDGELLTYHKVMDCTRGEQIEANPGQDLLKLVLLDRYDETPPVVAFIKGFGLNRGAIACSVAHDSHHIIAAGCDDQSISEALTWIIQNKGGMCVWDEGLAEGIRLPFFGLMSDEAGEEVARAYEKLSNRALALGSTLSSPFMTLSFMALTVIPSLKINHNGLFDGEGFRSMALFNY